MTWNRQMLRAEYSERGPVPVQQLSLRECPISGPGSGELLLAVRAAPINPSDLLTITGRYGLLPPLPAVAGNEGAGEVIEIGPDVEGFREGDRVVIPPGYGTWASHVIVPASESWKISPSADLLQMAMVRVNPPTAALMLSDFEDIGEGDWVVQNAATSAVGGYVIQLARHRGVRTVNIVRRPSDEAALLAMGADAVLVDGPDLHSQIRDATGGAKIRLGLDGVGGRATDAIALSLAAGGTVVHYGVSGGESSRISPRALIFRDICVRGFWLVHWFRRASSEEKARLYDELAQLIGSGVLSARIHRTYPLASVHEAVLEAASESRNGKVLILP